MTHTRLRPITTDHDTLTQTLAGLRREFELPGPFPADLLEAAREAVGQQQLPSEDCTDIPLVTIDPPGSMDLDQALHLARAGRGYTVHYAIADVPSLLAPESPLDLECRSRGVTFYAPDGRIPLHPEIISEDAGSLLPGLVRSSYLWTFSLDASGAVTHSSLRRARVRSRARLDYAQVQSELDAGTAASWLLLLKEVGTKRAELELERGGASLKLPGQEIRRDPENGQYTLHSDPALPVEGWNAQISLMTGMEAARIMLAGKVGLLRTMPPPDEKAIEDFQRQAQALGHPWQATGAGAKSYGQYLSTLDPAHPQQLAIIHAAATLFRGAGYTAFDGELPENIEQSAIAAPYAHATAPLRRLVDRWTLVICEALSNGTEVPHWARESLSELPGIMKIADQKAGRLDRAAIDTIEAASLVNRIGEDFDAVVISSSGQENGEGSLTLQVLDPPVLTRCAGAGTPGSTVSVRLLAADIASRSVHFALREGGPESATTGTVPASVSPTA